MRLSRRPIQHSYARLTALCASGALVVAGLSVAPNAAAVGADNPSSKLGAGWLKGEIIPASGMLVNDGDPDDVLSVDASIDASLAFAQFDLPAHQATSNSLLTAVEPRIQNYVKRSFYSEATGGIIGEIRFAGRIAKAAGFAFRKSQDLDVFAGGDLIDQLAQRVSSTSPIVGRVENLAIDHPDSPLPETDFRLDPRAKDTADVIDQAWAVEALKRAADRFPPDDALIAKADQATEFLLDQQCPGLRGGFFREKFTIDKDFDGGVEQNGQKCLLPDDRGDSKANRRTTAQVALIYLALDEDELAGTRLSANIPAAIDYLLDAQNEKNGYLAERPGEQPDAETTGLAGMVFAASGHPAEARKAAEWLRELQAFDPPECIGTGAGELRDQTGTIAPSKADYSLGKVNGIGGNFAWTQSTALALPLLRLAGHTPGPPKISGPTGFVQAGAPVTLRVSGLEIGEAVCVYGYKRSPRILADSTTELIKFDAPGGTANRRYTALSIEGSTATTLRVLTGTKLAVKVKFKTIKRKAKQKVVVSGLAAGERVRVQMKGKVVAKGKANSKGKFKKKFKVKAPKGKVKMKVWGQFNNRNGKAKFKIR